VRVREEGRRVDRRVDGGLENLPQSRDQYPEQVEQAPNDDRGQEAGYGYRRRLFHRGKGNQRGQRTDTDTYGLDRRPEPYDDFAARLGVSVPFRQTPGCVVSRSPIR